MSHGPKFAKTAEYRHDGATRALRAETSVSVKSGLFVRIDAPEGTFRDTGQAANFNRAEVEEFRDFLNEWLAATDLPTTPGSIVRANEVEPAYVLLASDGYWYGAARFPVEPRNWANGWTVVHDAGVRS